MLVLKNVEKHYSKFDLNCSLEIRVGMYYRIDWEKRCGKTTAFKIALGLVKKDRGTAEIFGKPAEQLEVSDRAQMGVVLADSGFSGYLTIRDLIPILSSSYPTFRKAEFVQNCERHQLPTDKKIK